MAELQSKKKSFNQAFAEARKRGESKFQWNGAWYSTQTKEEKNVPTKGGINRADYKQKIANSNGTVNNRFTVRYKNNIGYYVWDNDLQRQVGNAFKNKQDAVKYITSADVKNKYDEGFMLDAGETTITAARAKLNRNTAGFQPVDSNKNFVDKDGNTRLYQERGTGRYLVTDNNGNIVGYSFDPAAATADSKWGGWIAYTGSKDDVKAAAAGQLRDEANRNEVNQKARQAKERKVNEWDRQIGGLNRLAAGTNFVTSIANIPNHAIIGAVRAINPWSDYTGQDYINGFKIKNYFEGVNQSVGLGDVVGDVVELNPVVKGGLNIINPTSVASLASSYSAGAKGNAAVSHVNGQKVITNIPDEMVVTQGASPANKGYFARLVSKIKTRPFGAKGKQHKPLQLNTVPPTENGMVVLHNNTGSNNWFNIKGVKGSVYHSSTPGKATGSRFTAFQPWQVEGAAGTPILIGNSNLQMIAPSVVKTSETPTANFWYSGEGNPNTYAQGRIVTGEVVPGTSGETWNGGVSGGTVVVDNKNGQVAPAFGGITVGAGRDNQSGWYLPLAYKKGGKAKLVSKKSCRK